MNKFQKILLALSIGLNLAFSGVWLVHLLNKDNGPLEIDRLNQPALFQKIKISPEQWELIFPLVEDFKKTTHVQGQELNRLRCRLLDLMEAVVLDKNGVKNIQKALYALNLDMKKKAVHLLLEEKKFLTPLQYNALIQEIRERSNCEKKQGHGGGSFFRVLSNTPPGSAKAAPDSDCLFRK